MTPLRNTRNYVMGHIVNRYLAKDVDKSRKLLERQIKEASDEGDEDKESRMTYKRSKKSRIEQIRICEKTVESIRLLQKTRNQSEHTSGGQERNLQE